MTDVQDMKAEALRLAKTLDFTVDKRDGAWCIRDEHGEPFAGRIYRGEFWLSLESVLIVLRSEAERRAGSG